MTVNATSDVEISRYYYVIESNDTSGTSTNNTYSFSNLNLSTTYNISIFAEDINGVFSNKYNLNVETAEPQISLADWVISQYNGTQGNNGIYYHTSSLANSAADNSYRYAGDNPNNYVCFGSEEDTCPSSNRYRIIGVFDNQVKLIKSTSYGSYYWSGSNSNGSNVWGNSTLNTNILNRTFINNFSSTWQNKIATTSWKVGGPSVNISIYPNGTPANAYQNEVVSPAVNMTYSAKVGLIYVSDYYYGATPIFWTYPGYSYSSAPDANGNYGDSYDYRAAKGYNWLDLGSNEWTITHTSGNGNAYYVTSEGNVYLYSVDYLTNAVRPVFYLNSDVEYSSGDGTRENPIRLVV